MVDNKMDRCVFVLYSGRASQPMGIFSSKEEALKYTEEKGLWGNVAKYQLNVPLVDQVQNAGFSIGQEKNADDPNFIANFTSAYVVVAQVNWEDGKVMVTDRELQEKTEISEYLKNAL